MPNHLSRGLRVKTLIVEDDAMFREFLEEIARTRGHEVCSYADAEAAWDAYQHGDYPLVLLDVHLPGMDGLQLCRQMRALPQGAHSVIVVVTGQDQPDTLQAVLEAGADDYLAKPVPLASLAVRLTIAERQVEIVANPVRERYMPAAPEIFRIPGFVGPQEIVRQMESEDPGEPDRD